jgi:hypothetical protein
MRYGLACGALIAVTVLAAAACSSGISSTPGEHRHNRRHHNRIGVSDRQPGTT